MFDFADVDSPRPCMSTLAGNARGNPISIPPVQASQGSEPSLVPCEERSSSFVCSARSLLIVSSSSLMVVALSSRSRFAATSASRVLASASATSFFRFFSAVSRSSFRFCSTMATSAVLLFSASARSSFRLCSADFRFASASCASAACLSSAVLARSSATVARCSPSLRFRSALSRACKASARSRCASATLEHLTSRSTQQLVDPLRDRHLDRAAPSSIDDREHDRSMQITAAVIAIWIRRDPSWSFDDARCACSTRHRQE